MKTFSCEQCLKKMGALGALGALEKNVKAPSHVLDFTSVFDLMGALGALKSLYLYIFF